MVEAREVPPWLLAVQGFHQNLSPWETRGFIGGQPIELQHATLSQPDWDSRFVTEKKDGRRVLLTHFQAISDGRERSLWALTDRTNATQLISRIEASQGAAIFHLLDVLDGELCTAGEHFRLLQGHDDAGSGLQAGSEVWVFDALLLNGQDIKQEGFANRHRALAQRILELMASQSAGPEALHLRAKPITRLREIPHEKLDGLGMSWEGLIFYKDDEPYFGSRDAVLRWKHPEHLTVDLAVSPHVTNCDWWTLSAWQGGKRYVVVRVVNRKAEAEVQARLSFARNRWIGEFAVGPNQALTFRRWRGDKSNANREDKFHEIISQAENPVLLDDIRASLKTGGCSASPGGF